MLISSVFVKPFFEVNSSEFYKQQLPCSVQSIIAMLFC